MADLDKDVVEYINKVKNLEKQFLELLDDKTVSPDPRWKAIARTHIQEGRMAIVRSVTEK